MKGLNAIKCNETGEYLFSWTTHQLSMSSKRCCGVDGGMSGDYRRLLGNKDNFTDLFEEDIPIEIIRDSFTWGQNYDKEGNQLPETITRLLKDLTTDHIIGILLYFTEKLEDGSIIGESWIRTHTIFLLELQYRQNNKI